MKSARQVVVSAVVEWLEAGDIRAMASAIHEAEDGILSCAEREQIENDLGLWRFGKWALLGDGGPGQKIKAILEYQARVKESPTFWASIVPLNDDEGLAFDRLMAKHLNPRQIGAIKCHYQYHQSEDSGARILGLNRYAFRVSRDAGLRKLRDLAEIA